MNDEDRSRLADMAESARRIGEYLAGHDFSSFADDFRTQDAVTRRIEIVGEAAHKPSPGTKDALSALDVPVARIYGMRNRLAHDYTNTSLEILWSAGREEIPRLLTAAETLLNRP